MTVPHRTDVRLLDLREQNLALEKEFQEAFNRVLRSGTYIMGPEIENFEQATADFLQVRHSLAVSSGTDAILLALMALDLKPGDEVLCPSFTFFATAGCVARLGATPVFVDSCPVSFNIDVADAQAKITSRTKAVIVVHLFGQSADLDSVQQLAKAHHLRVIEDAAQSFGARANGRTVGSFGDFGTYSFFPSKNLGGLGDSGLLVTNDDLLAEQARTLRVHGSKPKYYHPFIGGNFRMDPLQAALLAIKLKHQDAYTRQRQSNAQYYQETLTAIPGVRLAEPSQEHQPLETEHSSATRIILPVVFPLNEHIWNQFTLRVLGDGQRGKLRQFLHEAGIGTEVYYPVPLHEQECFQYLPPSPCRNASQLAREVLSLPIYPELPRPHQEIVVQAIRDFLGT